MLILLTAPPRYIQASATKRENQPKWLIFNWVDYHTDLSNFYASYARLLRGIHFFEIRGYRFTLFAVFDDKVEKPSSFDPRRQSLFDP